MYCRITALIGVRPACTTQFQEDVSVPPTSSPLSDEQFQQLQQLVDPLVPCDDHGILLYNAAREFIKNYVR